MQDLADDLYNAIAKHPDCTASEASEAFSTALYGHFTEEEIRGHIFRVARKAAEQAFRD